MLDALVHGKLTDQQENMEDILTSTVFGLLRYAPLDDGLMRFLAECRWLDGSKGLPLATRSPVYAKFEFWRMLYESVKPCEPDLLVSLTDGAGARDLILIEAKYRSRKSNCTDKSTDDPTDQLAREWENLIALAAAADARPHMIYLTADHGVPRAELEESAAHFAERRPTVNKAQPLKCAWLSWRHLPQLFAESPSPVLRDLAQLANSMHLTFFAGFRPLRPVLNEEFHFAMGIRQFDFGLSHTRAINWSFDHAH